MKINMISYANKYYEHRELKERCEYKPKKQNNSDEHISFSEVLKREEQNTYSKHNRYGI